MGLVNFKVFFVVLVLALAFGASVMYGDGLLTFKADTYRCYSGKGFYAAVSKQTLFSLGRVTLYYQPLTWGCPASDQYDPQKVRKTDSGQLEPLPDAAN